MGGLEISRRKKLSKVKARICATISLQVHFDSWTCETTGVCYTYPPGWTLVEGIWYFDLFKGRIENLPAYSAQQPLASSRPAILHSQVTGHGPRFVEGRRGSLG